jgi:hypothetical protein
VSQQTEKQDWQIEGQQLRYVNAALQTGGIQPAIQYAGNGVYVITIVVPAGFDLPTYLDGKRGAPRRRSWWHRLDIGRWVPVALLLAAIGATLYVLAYGAPAALASAVPAMPMPDIKIDVPNPLAGVQRQIDGLMAGAMMIVQLAAGLVVLALLWTFRGPLSGIGGALWRGGSDLAGMFAKKGK